MGWMSAHVRVASFEGRATLVGGIGNGRGQALTERVRQAPAESGVATGTTLAEALRARTAALHRRAERSGIVRDLLHGECSLAGYLLYLRNLLPAYENLEQGLLQHRGSRAVGCVAWPSLFRSTALRHDLVALAGESFEEDLPLLPQGAGYARRIARAGSGCGELLIAHAYTRFLGDLHGGQLLKTRIAGLLGIGPAALTVYDFPQLADIAGARAAYRSALNRAGSEVELLAPVVREAAVAFRMNVSLSCAVARCAAEQR